MTTASSEGLLRAQNREKILAEANTEALLERFAAYEPAESEKWLRRLSEL